MTQNSSNEPPLKLDRFLPYLLNVLATRSSRGLATVYEKRFAMNVAEWRILAQLSQQDNLSEREVTRLCELNKSSVSRAATRMVDSGKLTKTVDLTDRRSVLLSLTPKGRALFAEIAPYALRFEEEMMSAFSPQEAKALRTMISVLLARIPGRAD